MSYRTVLGFAAVPLAALAFIGLASSVQAFRLPSDYHQGYQAEATRDTGRTAYHRCHGQGAGTADRRCGTITGGPSGGLH